MQEASFLNRNINDWKQIEKMLDDKNGTDPDLLSELFLKLTDDLSYARTFYPTSKTTAYLNMLTSKIHQLIYQKKKENYNRIILFWKYEIPEIVVAHKKELIYSFLIFIISLLIGVVSAANDGTFVRLILGDSYVNITLENIEKGDPLAIYKKMNEVDMFLGITFNNVMVAIYAFLAGVFLSFGTAFILLQNGIMLGAFQYFFYQHKLLYTSFLTIWIHGTIEISAIIIAGAAGLIMGNSILFPGTFSRMQSFKRGANDGLKLVLGLVPFFVVAGFLEGFITRHTEFPEVLKLSIIFFSLLIIIIYFVLYPIKIKSKNVDN